MKRFIIALFVLFAASAQAQIITNFMATFEGFDLDGNQDAAWTGRMNEGTEVGSWDVDRVGNSIRRESQTEPKYKFVFFRRENPVGGAHPTDPYAYRANVVSQ